MTDATEQARANLRLEVAMLLNIHETTAAGVLERIERSLENRGYRIVPVEPTEAMADAAQRMVPLWPFDLDNARVVYDAMLAAAPKVTP